MTNKKQPIKCSECQYCSGIRPRGNTRTNFSCSHPDQRYINDYFIQKGLRKMPGFLGFGYSSIENITCMVSEEKVMQSPEPAVISRLFFYILCLFV